jgi:GH15 family glucan-1,4-alpha-glucosidase
LVLSLAPLFMDERFRPDQTPATLSLMTRLARKAIAVAGLPDAGIWEYRASSTVTQTFSVLMSWAAADRMRAVALRHAPELVPEFEAAATRLRDEILQRAWNPTLGAFTSSYDGNDLDAALLHVVTLRLLSPDDPRAAATVDTLRGRLEDNGWMYRYRADDDFGTPAIPFVICTFWLVEALARIGRVQESRDLLSRVRAQLPPLGLMSEDFDPVDGRFWGNFPQAYSHVGMIRAAFAASPAWHEVV